VRVLHVTLSLARGGRRTAIFSLATGLRKAGVSSEICCLDQLGCPPGEVAHLESPVLVLGRRSLLDRDAIRRLSGFCRDRKVDIIHTHDAASQFTAALARLALPRTPLLMTFHRSLGMESATLSARLRNALAGWQSAAIITGSEERRAHFIAQNFVAADKVVRIPFGTDLSRFHPDATSRDAIRRELGIAPDILLVGAIGHFGPEKGIDLAIRSFRAMAGRTLPRPVAMIIFGDGERREKIEKLVSAEGPSPGSIWLAGFRPDIDRCMASIDVLLHTPRLEAFGLVIIEAMASGLPIVASRVGGIPDLVRDGSTGFLAEPGNCEAHAALLGRLLADPALLSSMGAEARRVALAEYGIDLYAARHLQLYKPLTARNE
jgi:glycosyltransferase involved in cell wall biosynthesis